MTEIDAKINKPFEISLRSGALSGYEWRPEFDQSALNLISKRHRNPTTKAFGAAGQEVFKFRAGQEGDHEISFKLVRPTDSMGAAEQKIYTLHVKP